MFKNQEIDWFQGRTLLFTKSCDPDLVVFKGYVHATEPDLILRIRDSEVLLSDILLLTEFVPSRAELHRAYKEGSLKMNNETVRQDKTLSLTSPDPFIEIRRARRFLEVIVGT